MLIVDGGCQRGGNLCGLLGGHLIKKTLLELSFSYGSNYDKAQFKLYAENQR